MTIALSYVTVADNIANLSISGVTVRTVSNIPQAGQMVMPILFPQPNGFITEIGVKNQSVGPNTAAAIDFEYVLHYVFLSCELGSGLSQLDPYSSLNQKLELIWETIMTNDTVTGLVDMRLNGVEGLGQVDGPDGGKYWGALFSLKCLEFAQ